MKKLNVKAVVIDLRHVSEETLASYEHIQIHASLAMTSPRTETLLAKYPVEMEAAALYLNAARLGKNALTICTISDNPFTGEELDAEARQNTFTQMMEIALEIS